MKPTVARVLPVIIGLLNDVLAIIRRSNIEGIHCYSSIRSGRLRSCDGLRNSRELTVARRVARSRIGSASAEGLDQSSQLVPLDIHRVTESFHLVSESLNRGSMLVPLDIHRVPQLAKLLSQCLIRHRGIVYVEVERSLRRSRSGESTKASKSRLGIESRVEGVNGADLRGTRRHSLPRSRVRDGHSTVTAGRGVEAKRGLQSVSIC
ncbi:hypothetical protein GGS26DRAFT_320951 [Hypomontagnella submonticulosa]|nr:hypothetical protein GGS26DRAFT_320951 [Hypomontagnella submonticulosa]